MSKIPESLRFPEDYTFEQFRLIPKTIEEIRGGIYEFRKTWKDNGILEPIPGDKVFPEIGY